MLSAAGISVVKNNSFPFSHQKYWIVDDRDVHLNTGNKMSILWHVKISIF